MSSTSILLLLDDGEMHPFVPNSSGGLTSPGGGNLVLTTSRSHAGSGGSDTPTLTYTVDGNIITTESGETISLGSHFLTSDNEIQPKIEVDGISMPMEVVVDKSGQSIAYKKSRKYLDNNSLSPSSNIPGATGDNDKKVCLWPTGNGTTCGKTFTKYDSLKRHLTETHKGVRPYACSMCDKTYGRRDYLQRHLKSHNASYALNLAGGGGSSTVLTSNPVSLVNSLPSASTNSMVQKIKIAPQTSNVQIVQMPQPVQSLSGVQIIQHSSGSNVISSPSSHSHHAVVSPPSPGSNSVSSGSTPLTTQLPFFTLNGSLPQASKPMGSKICRWVQNDGTVCGKAFSKLDSLRRHVNELHKGVRPFACPLCEKSYGRRDYLDRHMKTHEKKNKSSTGSGMEWDDGVLLTGDEMPPPPPKIPKKKRKDIPAEEKKICLWILDDGTACGKTFTKFDSLKRHVSEAHKQIRPYCCTLCGKNYGRRDYLLRHLRSHNDVEVSNLNIAKVTNNPSTGNTATIVAAPNPMPGQSASSISLSQLPSISTNQLGGILPSLHTSNSANANGGMTGHRLGPAVSGKKRPADDKKTCKWVLDNGTICGRTFSKFDSLRRHVAELHKGIRPFVCEICQKSYGRRDYLDRHIRSAHKEGGGGGGESDDITEMTTHELDEALDGATIVTVGGNHDDDDDEDEDHHHHHHIIKTDPTDLEEVILPSVVTVVTSDGM